MFMSNLFKNSLIKNYLIVIPLSGNYYFRFNAAKFDCGSLIKFHKMLTSFCDAQTMLPHCHRVRFHCAFISTTCCSFRKKCSIQIGIR